MLSIAELIQRWISTARWNTTKRQFTAIRNTRRRGAIEETFICLWQTTLRFTVDPHDYWDRAKHEYQEASRVAPKRDFPYINLAGVLTARAEFLLDTGGQGAATLLEEAKRNLDRAIEINSTFSHTFSQYGNMLRLTARLLIDSRRPASQELAHATANFDQAKTLDPSDPLPWLGAGRTDMLTARLRMDQGKLPIEMFRRAESNLAEAIKLNSADSQVYCVLADLYRLEASYLLAQKKDPEMSIQTGLQMADQALKIHPNLAEALAIRGSLLQQNARLQQDPSLREKMNQQGKDLVRQALQLNKNLTYRFSLLIRSGNRGSERIESNSGMLGR